MSWMKQEMPWNLNTGRTKIRFQFGTEQQQYLIYVEYIH